MTEEDVGDKGHVGKDEEVATTLHVKVYTDALRNTGM